jgi:hypothetical protein
VNSPPSGRTSATARAVSATSPVTPSVTGRCAPSADASSSTWATVAPGPISRPCRSVHMFSEQPQPTTRSAAWISSAASGEAKPPLTSRSHGLPRNRPLPAAEVASSAPHRAPSSSRSARAPGARAPRPAMNTGRRAADSASASAAADATDGATAGDGPTVGTALGIVHDPACTSSGRASTTVRRPATAVR